MAALAESPITPPSDAPVRLRIAHVVLDLEIGGMQKLLVEFARHADRDRHDLHVISLTTEGTLGEEIEACGWPVACLQAPPGLRPGMVLRLARLFRQLKPDIVHTHDPKPLLYAPLAVVLSRLLGKRPAVVHTRHGRDYGLSRRQLTLTRWASRLVDRYVCVSEDGARLSAEEGVPPDRIRTILNGIDLTRFTPAAPDPEGPAVLVARLSPEKDIETLLRAVTLLKERLPAFRLHIVGDGPSRPDLERFIADHQLAGHVRLLGEVRDVTPVLQSASLFVLPSRTEGVSLTLLEAMARGLPVVATRVGGNPEVVREGETGLLVPAGDPERLAEALHYLSLDPDLARKYGSAGRARVEEVFDIRQMVRSYEDLYAGLTGGVPPPAPRVQGGTR